MKKLILFILTVFCFISITACNAKPNNSDEKMPEPPIQEPEKLPSVSKPTAESESSYIVFGHIFVGCYSEKGWKPAGEVYLKDVLAQREFAIYTGAEAISSTSALCLDLSDDFGLSGFQVEGASEKLKKHGKEMSGYGSAYYRFDLPVAISGELDGLKMPPVNSFLPMLEGEKPYVPKQFELPRIYLSNVKSPFPRTIEIDAEPTQEAELELKRLFESADMGNTVPNFSRSYRIDMDGDGSIETLMLANNPQTEDGYPLLIADNGTDKLGTFSAALLQSESGAIQVIYADIRPFTGEFVKNDGNDMKIMQFDFCNFLSFIDAGDFTGDGIYEIGLTAAEWEGGSTILFAADSEGVYKNVITVKSGT